MTKLQRRKETSWQITSNFIGAGILLLAGWANVSLIEILEQIHKMETQIQLNLKDTHYLRKEVERHIAHDESHLDKKNE